MPALLTRVVEGNDLSRDEARHVMDELMSGLWEPEQVAGLLTAMRMKGETAEELAGMAESLRTRALRWEKPATDAVDTCGTGGDGGRTFNISTAAAILASACGVKVAKHGNRAVSSKSGSADVLEALGVQISTTPDAARAMLEQTGICFLYAPLYHQAMRHVMPARKALGFRTCFNLLGPLANPAGVRRQLVGVYDPDLTETVARVLLMLGIKRAMVVAGMDGLDEISVSGPTRVSEVRNGHVRTYTITPEEMGLTSAPLVEVAGGDAQTSAALIRRVFAGERGAPRDIVLANAGAVLWVGDQVGSLDEGVRVAARAIDEGAALRQLEEMVRFSVEVCTRVS
ncbi:anthranilate phosphoribosyltransferase [Polycladomyces abyssicola]|uniref:Anthranilate phosphoribosyltransferase n=1 Tax=Polycladomyces abyssicola TaxID=1125966 RepID=A0A8D5ZML5_9BACL|nr:anthranilate phosphoribosyltransferase [Polycladomyces abyssicola]BCU81795.1 anthranilate phosphoribosyltransferase [Polycladomyces abyssicola]